MKHAAILVAFFVASSVIKADDADEDQTPVTPIMPVATAPVAAVIPVQTVWTLKPIVVNLIAVLASPAPSPSQIQALVAPLAVGDIAPALSAFVSKLSADQVASVSLAAMNNPAAYSAFVEQLTSSQLLSVVAALQNSPTALSALVATMSVDQAAKVVAALASDTATLSVVLSQMDASKLNKVRIDLFLTDLDGWAAVSNFLDQPAPQKPFGNWLSTERAALAARIVRDGYTPAHLSEAQTLMQKATAK